MQTQLLIIMSRSNGWRPFNTLPSDVNCQQLQSKQYLFAAIQSLDTLLSATLCKFCIAENPQQDWKRFR